MMKLLVTDELSKEGIDMLTKDGGVQVDVKPKIPQEDLIKIIGEYDALIVRSGTKVTAQVIEAGKKLRVVGRAGVGVDNVDVDAATRRGILVMNTPSANIISACEHTMAMMLSLARNIPWADKSVKEGKWEKSKFMGVELSGKTLGIIGIGRIGGEVAKRAKAFGMKLIGFDPYISPEAAVKLGVRLLPLDKVCEEADFITVHAALTPTTHNLVSTAQFNLMKPTVMIVNCARGGIIDEAAWVEALRTKRIAGSAIDVFEQEPLPQGLAVPGIDQRSPDATPGSVHEGGPGEGLHRDGGAREDVPGGQPDHQRGQCPDGEDRPEGGSLPRHRGAARMLLHAAHRRPSQEDRGGGPRRDRQHGHPHGHRVGAGGRALHRQGREHQHHQRRFHRPRYGHPGGRV